jgi:kynurenine formamidase
VLVDFASWAVDKGEAVDPTSPRGITLKEIEEILAFQNTSLLPGDIIIFRTGFLDWYIKTEPKARHTRLYVEAVAQFIGLAQDRDIVEWIWNNQIAAVASDSPGLERVGLPLVEGVGILHEQLIAGLGCPIGELFATEKLAERCKSTGRYTFFIASVPLHVTGGAASPSNAMALF